MVRALRERREETQVIARHLHTTVAVRLAGRWSGESREVRITRNNRRDFLER
jgi:hypothetical protein